MHGKRAGDALECRRGDALGIEPRHHLGRRVEQARGPDVAHGVGDQRPRIADQLGVEGAAALERELPQHALAEAVDREHSRLVEPVQRGAQPAPIRCRGSRASVRWRTSASRSGSFAATRGSSYAPSARSSRSRRRRRSSAVAALVKVTTRMRPIVEFPLEHRAQRERRDRERLAGAGARLDELQAGELGAERIELRHAHLPVVEQRLEDRAARR